MPKGSKLNITVKKIEMAKTKEHNVPYGQEVLNLFI